MNNKQEISKSHKCLKDNDESNYSTKIDKNWNSQEENNLKKEKGYKNIKMKMKYAAPKKSRIIYYKDSEGDSSKRIYFSNNNLNKNSIIMKNIKNLVPFKIPTQKNVHDNKNKKNVQKEQKNKNNENENENENYEEEFIPKFNGNNPLERKGSIKMKKLLMGIEENPLKSVANKIRNIKKDKNENKNKYIGNNEIIDSDITYKETIEFENVDINGNEYFKGEEKDENENDKEQCEENGFEEIDFFNNNYEEEEQKEFDQQKNEEQGDDLNEEEKNNGKNNEEDEIVNYDNRNIIKNKYDNTKLNRIKKKENIIKEQNSEKIIKIHENNKIEMQKAQSFLQPNCMPQKLKKIDKIKEIKHREITKNNFDSKSYGEKFAYSNKNENNPISKGLDDKKEVKNILTNKNNILKQEKNDKIKSQNKIISKIKDENKNNIGKNDINISSSKVNNSYTDKKNQIKMEPKNNKNYTKVKSYKESIYTSSRNQSLNSVKNNSLKLILPEKSLNSRNKANDINFLASVRTPNNKLRPISSQKLLDNNNKKINLINSNNLNKIEKSHINDLRENRETTKNIKGKKAYDTFSNNNEINKELPFKKDEQKRNTNTQHIIMISSKRNYNSKDKDENTITNMNINDAYNKTIVNKYNNRYNNNTLSFKSDKINENEIENSGITHSIKYTNKKNKPESNNNCKPHSIIIINSTNSNKEENKKLGREYITSSSILNQSLGCNDRHNLKNNSIRNLGKEYQSDSTSINNNISKNNNKVNIINDNINTNKSLNLNKGYKVEINSPRQRASHINNNVHTIYISPGSKIKKENKKEIKQKEIKHTNEIYYSSYFSNKKNNSKNDSSFNKSICSINTSSVKSDKKKDIINKPITHNTLIIKSKRGEIKDKPESNEKNSFKLNLNNITISSSVTSKRTIKSTEKNEIKDELTSNAFNSNKNVKNDDINISQNNTNKKINDDNKKIDDVKEEIKFDEINENSPKEENANHSTIPSSKNKEKGPENNKDLMINNSEFNVNEKKDEIPEIKTNSENNEAQKEDKSEINLNNEFFNSNINTDEFTSTKTENKIENLLQNDNDIKQEKIENKFDFLNFGSSFNINSNTATDNNQNINNENMKNESEKIKEESIFDRYPFLSNPELSDYTKEYLNLYKSTTRHELSDYTKAYLNSLGTSTSTSTTRPELSNLTKAYLLENTIGFDDIENKGS